MQHCSNRSIQCDVYVLPKFCVAIPDLNLNLAALFFCFVFEQTVMLSLISICLSYSGHGAQSASAVPWRINGM